MLGLRTVMAAAARVKMGSGEYGIWEGLSQSMKKVMKKRILFYTAAIAASVLILIFLQALLMPKYMTSIPEGNLVEEYYRDTKDHDVIFVGDCEVFSNVSPVKLWEDYGITSYIRGSAQQLPWQSYYLLEETLKYEKPRVVVFNVLAMKYNEPQKEAYNRLTLDGMRLSPTKIRAVNASMTEGESLMTYLFPLLRYHSRWSELTSEDINYVFHRDKLSHNGYLMRVDVKPAGQIPRAKKLGDYRFGKNAYDYLDRMTKLCKENGIELLLIKSPSIYPYWYGEWDQQMVDYAEKNGLTYINFLPEAEKLGIDYEKDTFDGGLHLNLSGAEKFTDRLGEVLHEEYGLKDHRNNKRLCDLWQKKIDFYDSMRENQEQELRKYGYLKSYSTFEEKGSAE